MNVEEHSSSAQLQPHPFRSMFKTLLLAAALVISAPVQAETMHNNYLLSSAGNDVATEQAQMEPDHQQQILKILDLKIARR